MAAPGLRRALGALALLLAATAAAQGPPEVYPGVEPYTLQPRVALVIGIPTVRPGAGFLPLKSPREDARAVTARLRELGFTVFAPTETHEDDTQLTRQAIKQHVYDFARLLKATRGVGVVYYSGHGIVDAAGKRAYLIPYDARIDYARDLSEELIPVSLLYDAFDHADNVLNVLVIDACRDAPYAGLQPFGRSSFQADEREVERVYRSNATTTGDKADDVAAGSRLSPYATAFLDALNLPDAGLSQVFDKVASRLTELGVKHQPSIQKVGSRDFVFLPTVVSYNREEQTYRQGGTLSLYQGLYKQFAGGYFGQAALAYAENPTLQPPPPDTTVAAKAALRLQAQASFSSPGPVIAGGSLLRITGLPTMVSGQAWLPVRTTDGSTGFVERTRTQALQARPSDPLELRFEADAAPGTERLVAASQSALEALLAGAPPTRVVGASIVATRATAGMTAAASTQALLARQAAVAQRLQAYGIAPNIIQTRLEDASTAEQAGQVRLVLQVQSASP